MAKQFQLPEDEYQVLNAKGETVISAPLLDLFYLIANAVGGASDLANVSQIDKFAVAAHAVNSAYGTSLSPGQVLSIFVDLSESVEDSKKNTTSTLE